MLRNPDPALADELRLLAQARAALDRAEHVLALPLDPARLAGWGEELVGSVREMKQAGLLDLLPQRQTADLLGAIAAHALSLRWTADAWLIERRSRVPLNVVGTAERLRSTRRALDARLVEARAAVARWERCVAHQTETAGRR